MQRLDDLREAVSGGAGAEPHRVALAPRCHVLKTVDQVPSCAGETSARGFNVELFLSRNFQH
jgi:hypothetical protein